MNFNFIQTRAVIVSMAALLASISTTAMAQSANIGVNAAIKGDVTIQTAEETAKQAVVKDKVYLGQKINAEKLSSLQILLKDETVFTVGPECEMTIDKYVYDPDKNNNSLTANVSKGMFRFMSGNVSKQGAEAVNITTPVGSMGVRGTIVEGLIGKDVFANATREGLITANMAFDPAKATMFILRGPGKNKQGVNRKGEITITSGTHTVTVKGSNKGVFIPSPGAKPIVFTPSLTTYKNFSDQLRTKPTNSRSYSAFEFNQNFDLSKAAIAGGGAKTQIKTNPTLTDTVPKTTGSTPVKPVVTTGGGLSGGTVIIGLGTIAGIGVLINEVTNDDDTSGDDREPETETQE